MEEGRHGAEVDEGGAVEGIEGDAEEGLEGVLHGPGRRVGRLNEVEERREQLRLRADDGSVGVDDEEAVEGGGGGLSGGGGGGAAEDMGEGVEEGRGGHEGVPVRDGDVEEDGHGVLLRSGAGVAVLRRRGVERLDEEW